jgi:hypothetical protein
MGGWWVRGGISRASLGDGRITRPAHPRSRNRIHLFLPFFFSDRSRFGHAIPGSARGVSGAFGVSSVLCYTGVSFLLGLLSFSSMGFRSVSVSSPVFLYLWLIHRRIPEIRVWSSCWIDGMTTRVWNLRCCVACHFVMSLGSERF